MKYLSSSNKETKEILGKVLEKFPKKRVFCLFGDLGSGKTTFTKGLSKDIGLDEKQIKSPTFTIMNKYENRGKAIYHLDLYRINSYQELLDIGFDEMLNDQNSKIFIEWPEKIEDDLPEERLDIYFKYLDEEKREILIKN